MGEIFPSRSIKDWQLEIWRDFLAKQSQELEIFKINLRRKLAEVEDRALMPEDFDKSFTLQSYLVETIRDDDD